MGRLIWLSLGVAMSACNGEPAEPPGALPAGVRPIGAGPRYSPALRERPVPDCRPGLGPRIGAHVELFADDRVVIVPGGIGTRGPWRRLGARIEAARCYGALVTIDPTGLVLIRPGTQATVGDLFAIWGRPLGHRRMIGFRGRVRGWLDGRRWRGDVRRIPLRRHAQVVLEVGPYVPPHARYTFPAGW